MAAGHRHTQHGHAGFGSQHTRQVRRATRSGNDGLEAAPGGAFGVGEHVVRHTVGRDHLRFVRDTELPQNLDCVLHGLPIAGRAHDDANMDGFHVLWGPPCQALDPP